MAFLSYRYTDMKVIKTVLVPETTHWMLRMLATLDRSTIGEVVELLVEAERVKRGLSLPAELVSETKEE